MPKYRITYNVNRDEIYEVEAPDIEQAEDVFYDGSTVPRMVDTVFHSGEIDLIEAVPE